MLMHEPSLPSPDIDLDWTGGVMPVPGRPPTAMAMGATPGAGVASTTGGAFTVNEDTGKCTTNH